ncbi:MAG: hypothetical protein JHC26_01245 [Thermofilum sp.]|uniref:hypothetical protein n=1 Tax=Thermofilum sp. TaxID=1961369 RepID=UPI00258654D4|nr:hypothetical protein [Thermofilum sp.]MCI4407685.1 hypothetical protein [Thermofilum sp.]
MIVKPDEIRELLNKCRRVQSDPNGNWEVRICRMEYSLAYAIVAKDNKKEYVIEAFVDAKRNSFLKLLPALWWFECDNWLGAVSVDNVSLAFAVTDYSKVECVTKFMEIVKEIVKKLSEVRE